MISLTGPLSRCCEGLSRRELIRIGGLSVLGLSLPQLLRSRAAHASDASILSGRQFGRAKSCIVVFLFGAPAHQDTWDMKPDSPSEVRGEFKPIGTRVPGTLVCEHMPRIAQIADRLSIVRSMSHPDNTHTVAMHYMLTGTRHVAPNTNPRNAPSDFPTFGAVMNYLNDRADERSQTVAADGARRAMDALPRAISLNAPANQVSAANFIFPGFFAGFLGSAYDPLFIAQDANAADFQAFPPFEESERLSGRRSLLQEMNRRTEQFDQIGGVRSFDRFHERAIDLIVSRGTREACDLSRETPAVRDRYGRNSFGQACLLGRRLVEAGVSLVTVNWARDDAFWD